MVAKANTCPTHYKNKLIELCLSASKFLFKFYVGKLNKMLEGVHDQ